MDEGTLLVYCCPSTFSLTSPPAPPFPKYCNCTVYTDSVWLGGGGLGYVVDHILQSTGTGGTVPALVAQYRHWWRSTGTGGAVTGALVAQCVKGLLPR
jgi:hypothetical protein